MSFKSIRLPLTLAALVPLMAASTRAPLDLQPESKLTISGTSTVRAFQCQASAFDAKVESSGSGAVAAILAGEKAVSSVLVTVPAEKLDCRNGTMNEHMRKALKADQFASIVFKVDSYDLATGTDGVAVKLNGTLTLGGVEKPITVTALAKAGENGTLLVSGTQDVRMTEFGLKPPTLMLGTMKVGERIKVGFDVVLKD
jgi:polyisoprenoid-binding protein YceI